MAVTGAAYVYAFHEVDYGCKVACLAAERGLHNETSNMTIRVVSNQTQ